MTSSTPSKRPSARGSAAYPRKRAVRACQVCRARRTKCDNAKPSCSFCLKVGTPCVQSTTDLSSFDPASLEILERLDKLDTTVTQYLSTANAAPSKEHRSSNINRAQILPESIESVCRWPTLAFTSTIAIASPINHTRTPTADGANSSPRPIIDELQPHQTKVLVANFFQYVHVKNPVLDRNETRRMVAHLSMEGIDWSPESCLALLVLALGATASPFFYGEAGDKDPDALSLAKSFYQAAQKRLGMVMGSGTLIEAQCFFLAGVYMMTTFQRHTAWKFFLQALACCQDFDFLRLSKAKSGLDVCGAESDDQASPKEQSMYWSAWKSERELREDMEAPDFAPSAAELAIYPAFFPTPPLMNDSRDAEMGSDDQHYWEMISWYFYLSEISLRRLSSRIVNEIIQCRIAEEPFLEALAKATAMHEAQAEEWVLTLPDILSLSSPPQEDEICRFVLRGHLINLYELMYWPFVRAAINGETDGPESVESSAESNPLIRSLARKGLERHVERLWVNQPGYKHRHHGTIALLRACGRSALILIAAAIAFQRRLEQGLSQCFTLPAGWQHAVMVATEMLEYWEAESPDSRYILGILRAALDGVKL